MLKSDFYRKQNISNRAQFEPYYFSLDFCAAVNLLLYVPDSNKLSD